MTISYWLTVLFFALVVGQDSLAQRPGYRISEEPAWIQKVEPTFDSASLNNSNSAYYYLLFNRQTNVREEHDFVHHAVKILSTEGLREMSNLTIDFDPTYQELVFHRINVVRGDNTTSQLDQSLIQLVQREPSMDRQVYDGRLTAVANLKNTRIGDVIDYSYSIIGRNPVFAGRFSARIYQQFSIPIEHLYFRLVVPRERELHFTYSGGAAPPEHHQSQVNNTYVWDFKHLPIKMVDINTPAWYDPYPHVVISEYSSWGDVVEWGMELFETESGEGHQLKERVKDIVTHSSIDTTILRAIRFIQDDIRYLGLHDGLYAYQPHAPIQVLDQRYGDCKDKSLLLSALLQACGIDAYPVLVHTSNGYSLGDYHPSPLLFNHCVVQIVKDGETYYVDPTISNQGGDLQHFYFPNYRKGLVLREGEKELIDLPVSQLARTRITEEFMLEEIGQGARLHVLTRYMGRDADYQRELLASRDLGSIQKSYIDFYSRLYSHIRAERDLKIVDRREGVNELTLEEYYIIDSIWYSSEEHEQIITCEFYPLSLVDYVTITKSPARTMPYQVYFPLDVEHETVVKLPEEWNVANDSVDISAEPFRYAFSVEYEDSVIKLTHAYKTMNNFITAEEVDAFVEKHGRILDNLSYQLEYNKELAGSTFRFSWPVGLFAIVMLVIGSFGARLIYTRYDGPVAIDSSTPRRIGGWLIVVAIGFFLSPIQLAYKVASTPEFFNSAVWSALMDIDGPTRSILTGLLVFAELVYNIAFFVFSLLIIVLFFRRRTVLPRLAIIFLLLPPVVLALDTGVAWGLNSSVYGDADLAAFIKEMVQHLVRTAIWIPYFLVSTRVKQTFVLKSPMSTTNTQTPPVVNIRLDLN